MAARDHLPRANDRFSHYRPGLEVGLGQEQLRSREARQAELDIAWEAARAAHAAKHQSEDSSVPFILPRSVAPAPTHPCVAFLSAGTSVRILWDVVDELLRRLCTEPDPTKPAWIPALGKGRRQTKRITESLGLLLAESWSVYEIAPDQRGLQRRMETTLAASISAASGTADAAGYSAARVHLEKARGRLFGLHPDPSGAYDEAVRANEAIVCPLFLPNDQMPTLGKILAHLRGSSAYEFVVTGKGGAAGNTNAVVAMMASVWEGHSDRHAGGPETPLSPARLPRRLSPWPLPLSRCSAGEPCTCPSRTAVMRLPDVRRAPRPARHPRGFHTAHLTDRQPYGTRLQRLGTRLTREAVPGYERPAGGSNLRVRPHDPP